MNRRRLMAMMMDSGEAGLNWSDYDAAFDLTDITTQFQDAARTNPVTADGQIALGVTDKSGHGHHMTATNGAAYKENIVNGKSGLLFDGSNDAYVLTLPTFMNLAEWTVTAVYKQTVYASKNLFGFSSAASAYTAYGASAGLSGGVGAEASAARQSPFAIDTDKQATTWDATNIVTYRFSVVGGVIQCFVNGLNTAPVSLTITPTGASVIFRIGNSPHDTGTYYPGYLFRLFASARALSDAERMATEAAQSTDFSVPLA